MSQIPRSSRNIVPKIPKSTPGALSTAELGFQYPERGHSLLLACSFYTHGISASITCYPTSAVYVIEFSAY